MGVCSDLARLFCGAGLLGAAKRALGGDPGAALELARAGGDDLVYAAELCRDELLRAECRSPVRPPRRVYWVL